jgi:subtilisin family serine protease
MRLLLVSGLAAAALAAPMAAQAFDPNDPLSQRQWYLVQDRAFNALSDPNSLPPVRVAVIDSGVEVNHPELKGRIVESRSFVGDSVADVQGHGTFVAGEIAAATDNGLGIAGLAPPARLLVAKVVRDDGSIPPNAEARAIRWAVGMGAQVINLSLGSTRDPLDATLDGFSPTERSAVAFAVKRGVLVVASVGNGNDAPAMPWPFASYPAALPHVLGVAAYSRSGSVPSFSNRDELYVDVAAPGQDILSLFPRPLTARYAPTCPEQGYSSCGTKEYRRGDGTSFAAPQVTAAAALLLALNPLLRPDQISKLLERTAADATPATGCSACTSGRDSLTGFGSLDVSAAVRAVRNGVLPTRDRLEPNDDAGLSAAPIYAKKIGLRATIDYWDDPTDVYRIPLKRGQRVTVRVRAGNSVDVSLALWKPALRSLVSAKDSLRAARSIHPPGAPEWLTYRARSSGWYYLQVKLAAPDSGPYTIRFVRS